MKILTNAEIITKSECIGMDTTRWYGLYYRENARGKEKKLIAYGKDLPDTCMRNGIKSFYDKGKNGEK